MLFSSIHQNSLSYYFTSTQIHLQQIGLRLVELDVWLAYLRNSLGPFILWIIFQVRLFSWCFLFSFLTKSAQFERNWSWELWFSGFFDQLPPFCFFGHWIKWFTSSKTSIVLEEIIQRKICRKNTIYLIITRACIEGKAKWFLDLILDSIEFGKWDFRTIFDLEVPFRLSDSQHKSYYN